MKEHHYLGFKHLVGESVRYVALLEEKWVALLGFCSGTFTSAPRDLWISWSVPQRLQRLKHIVNNSRFLILPGIQIPNLASKTLALTLKRISDDWQKKYGHPVLLAETFVDHTLFSGSCYRAAGFIPLGKTRGFGRSAGKYYPHGKIKTHFARPLYGDTLKQLSAPFPTPFMLTGTVPPPLLDLNRLDLAGLVAHMEAVKDPRKRCGVCYRFSTPLSIIVLAALLGAESLRQISQMVDPLPQKTLKELGCMRRRIYLTPENSIFRLALKAWICPPFYRLRPGGWKKNAGTGLSPRRFCACRP
jgi:hypothetical protein